MTDGPPHQPLLSVKNVTVRYEKAGAPALDGVSFELDGGAALGLVGESGSGKSTLARAITRLVPVDIGTILFQGEDILATSGKSLRRFRRDVQIVFQDSAGSLNPRMKVGRIVAEPLEVHHVARGRKLHTTVGELLERVGLPATAAERYPHEFSGGQRQRIGIARALALHPKLIILDEPVSALDVSVQAQILNMLAELREALGLTYLFIAHNLSVVKHICDRVAVMQHGRIVELADSGAIFAHPQHAYTRALLRAVPTASAGPTKRNKTREPGSPNAQSSVHS